MTAKIYEFKRKVEKPELEKEPDNFQDRMVRIKEGLDKINAIMESLKNTDKKK